ncbi:MAG: vanadium-dependent haloperoxidase [Gammaproteobacteria bacterium]
MAVFSIDVARFDPTAPATESAERQRVTVARQLIPNTRPSQPDNGDFAAHGDKRGTFTKGLKHDAQTGRVDPAAFAVFQAALSQSRSSIFDAIEVIDANLHLGAGAATRPWVNPVAGRAWSVTAGDPQQYVMPLAPAFGTDELSFEIVENYWMALLRDVPFSQYEVSALATQAAQELTVFRNAAIAERQGANLPAEDLAPVDDIGNITPRTLFRGLSPGEDKGPFLSQFLIHPVPFGVQGFHQRNRTLRPGTDFMTQWPEWLCVQNGAPRDFVSSHFDDVLHYMRNGRDLSQWVHVDVLFQGYFNACLILLQGSGSPSSVGGGIGAPRSATNPYNTAKRQQGFGTLGDPAHIGMMCEVAVLALKAVWFQKWFVHLRLRPEAYAGRIDYERRNPGLFNLPANLLNSGAVAETVNRYGTALLPMAFPEGSPMHPAYGAGHATVAGACVTILKALFDGNAIFPNPVDVLVDGLGQEHLVPYACSASGMPDLTVEGELNKLASNIALGRNIAGVHWRSDGTYSMRLGEAVAIDLLRAYAKSYPEFASGETVFQFNKFDGTLETITA